MKRSYLTILTVLAGVSLLTLSSCMHKCVKGSGNQITENRKVTDFKKIDVSGAFKIILKQDSSLNINISADDNLLKYIKTEVNGGKLRISTAKRSICNSDDMVIIIGVRNLESIESSGAVEITSNGKLVTKDLSFDLAGIAKINMDLDAANVKTDGSGAAEITLRGQASSHSIDMSGGAKIHAFDFIVGNYNISSSGATDCEINVLHELNVSTSGASSIKYKGNPIKINNDKSGVSSIIKVN